MKFARGDWTKAPDESSSIRPWQESKAAPRTNLPTSLTSFIGREKELDEVVDLLAQHRLVTLMGAGGMGKTRLSIEVGRQLLSEFPDGVFFVALAPLNASNLIGRAVVQALGFMEVGNLSTEQQLREGIGNKRMLLVVDNCEHLIEGGASLVTDLLSTCPQIKFIATSRESLRIPGEWIYAVPALGIMPKENKPFDLETALKSPMLMLFAERARAVRSDFALTKDNLQSVTSICTRLDGMPLAIELIAARIRLMPPQTLLDRLSGQFILSVEGMRTASARQKTLNDTIGWSYNLLSEEEQKCFAYLSVFSGGFTLEAAETMFSSRITEKLVSELIALLLDKSLLQRVPTKDSDARYTMLETIREFAFARLRSMRQEDEIRNLHLEFFLAHGEQADQEIHGPNQVRTMPNAGDYPAIYARPLCDMGYYSWASGDNLREAHSFLNESQQIALQLGIEGEQILAETLIQMDLTEAVQGNDRKSIIEHSLELNKKLGNQGSVARILLHLGIAEKERSPKQAFSFLEESLSLLHQLGDLFFNHFWTLPHIVRLFSSLKIGQQ